MHLLLSLCILSSFLNSLAQCPNTAPVVNSYLAPTNLGGPAVVRTFTAGTSQIMTTMTLGFTYQVDTCTNSAAFDPELSIYSGSISGPLLGFNDNFCGNNSLVTFVANNQSARINLHVAPTCSGISQTITVFSWLVGSKCFVQYKYSY